MNSDSLRHDVAWATAISIVHVFAGLLREEEQRDAVEEVYARVKAGIERFEMKQRRLDQRMRPGKI
jgi:hypothetical protein